MILYVIYALFLDAVYEFQEVYLSHFLLGPEIPAQFDVFIFNKKPNMFMQNFCMYKALSQKSPRTLILFEFTSQPYVKYYKRISQSVIFSLMQH